MPEGVGGGGGGQQRSAPKRGRLRAGIGGLWPAKRGQSDSGAVIPGQGGQQVKAGAEAGGRASLEHRAGPEGWVVASLAPGAGALLAGQPWSPRSEEHPGPQGGRGCPWEVRQLRERGHGKKGICRNQRFI